MHVDHTFGSASDPFGRVFVLDGVATRSSDLRFDVDGDRFSEQARRDIISVLDNNDGRWNVTGNDGPISIS